MKNWIKFKYPKVEFITVSLKEAISNDVLPDPKILLIPLTLDNTNSTEVLVKKNKKSTLTIDCFYKDRWKYMKLYNCNIKCTPQQYYNEISQEIEYWKKQSMFKKSFEFKWLKCCNDRLKWLSNQKETIVITILKHLKDYRVLTFCNSIEQTEKLGKYCINSKNKESINNLQLFNEGKVKHITSVAMLDEGCNLAQCRIGLFAMLNSSDRMIFQRLGRILRHKEPVIIIPYYKNTREEEIVVKMIENYNKDLIQVIKNINDIEI
jgi:superfamily II DNA or RNA helicase